MSVTDTTDIRNGDQMLQMPRLKKARFDRPDTRKKDDHRRGEWRECGGFDGVVKGR